MHTACNKLKLHCNPGLRMTILERLERKRKQFLVAIQSSGYLTMLFRSLQSPFNQHHMLFVQLRLSQSVCSPRIVLQIFDTWVLKIVSLHLERITQYVGQLLLCVPRSMSGSGKPQLASVRPDVVGSFARWTATYWKAASVVVVRSHSRKRAVIPSLSRDRSHAESSGTQCRFVPVFIVGGVSRLHVWQVRSVARCNDKPFVVGCGVWISCFHGLSTVREFVAETVDTDLLCMSVRLCDN